jgi:hypothetical protein
MPGSMFVGSSIRAVQKVRRRLLTAQMLHSIMRPGKSFRAEFYGGLRMRVWCGAICLIALIVTLSNQETCASKQLAPQPRTRICKPLKLYSLTIIPSFLLSPFGGFPDTLKRSEPSSLLTYACENCCKKW